MADFPNILDTPPSPGGGGAYVQLDEQLITNGATLDFGTISQAYNSLMIVVNKIVNLTNNQLPQLRVSTDNGATFLTTTIYDYAHYGYYGSFQSGTATAQTSLPLIGNALVLGSAGIGLSINLKIDNYTNEAGDGVIRVRGQSTAGQVSTTIGWVAEVGGGIRVGSAINGIRLFFGTGNLTGQARLYGLT